MRARSTTQEAFELADELLADIELGRIPLSNTFLKAARLARLLGDTDMLQTFKWELAGYPNAPTGLSAEAWRLASRAGREFSDSDPKTKEVKTYCYVDSVEEIEAQIRSAETRLKLTEVPPTSISSANPNQIVRGPIANIPERDSAQRAIHRATKRLAARRAFVFEYVLDRHTELRVFAPADTVFQGYLDDIRGLIGQLIPSEAIKIDSISENLESDNPEDWANAVHSCRRLLQKLADAIFPPTTDQVRGGKKKKLGPENYINRLVCFCEDNSESSIYQQIVGSSLHFIGDRLDALFSSAQKGSHSEVSKQEARRTVIYTLMCVGDLLYLASHTMAATSISESLPERGSVESEGGED